MTLKISIGDKLPLADVLQLVGRVTAPTSRKDRLQKALRVSGIAALGAVGLVALGVFLARDQMVRHRRELFSAHPLRRLAALSYLKSRPQVDNVMLLRDFLAWEERPLLRKRAAAILEEMEASLATLEDGGAHAGV